MLEYQRMAQNTHTKRNMLIYWTRNFIKMNKIGRVIVVTVSLSLSFSFFLFVYAWVCMWNCRFMSFVLVLRATRRFLSFQMWNTFFSSFFSYHYGGLCFCMSSAKKWSSIRANNCCECKGRMYERPWQKKMETRRDRTVRRGGGYRTEKLLRIV